MPRWQRNLEVRGTPQTDWIQNIKTSCDSPLPSTLECLFVGPASQKPCLVVQSEGWCVSLVCLTGVSHWCVSLVCLTGMSHWCVSLVCLTGVSHWCVSLLLDNQWPLARGVQTKLSVETNLHSTWLSYKFSSRLSFSSFWKRFMKQL